ncbi:MAG: amidohydrolase family protein [Gammaproteobacteria bacterium]|nr:amidohydrolase family protein [Gammaproteobacteria bacterium]
MAARDQGRLRSRAARALAICAALAAAGAHADRPRTYAITGARIVSAPGTVIEQGTLVLRDGLVEAVGAGIAVPPDAEVIPAEAGWTVYPALVDAAATVGLDTEASAAPAPRGRNGEEPPRPGSPHELKAVHPEAAVVDQLDVHHASVARHREMGFGAAQVLPLKGVFRGESAVLMLRDGPPAELVLRPHGAQVVALETASFMARQYPSSKFGAVAAVRQAFLDARRAGEWNARWTANPAGMAPPEFRASDAALLAALAGERPLAWVTLAALDTGRFAGIATEFGLQGGMVIARGLGDRADTLVAAGMPVLLPLELPAKPDLGSADDLLEANLEDMQAYLAAPHLPAELARAGVSVALVTAGMKNPRRFTENLGALVKAGLPADQALAAVTTTPARLLGLSAALGTLEPGKQANVMIVAGDLFDGKATVRHLFVQGHHEKFEAAKVVGDPNAVVDPRGRWTVTTEVMGRTAESTWTIAGERDAWTGSSESARAGKRDFTSVTLQGNALTVVSPGPGGEMKITVVLTGDAFKGESTMTSERGSVTMKLDGRRAAGPQESAP